MTIEKFKEFQKYIAETDFTADGEYFYKLYISHYYFTDIERGNEETKLYEGKQYITDVSKLYPQIFERDHMTIPMKILLNQ